LITVCQFRHGLVRTEPPAGQKKKVQKKNSQAFGMGLDEALATGLAIDPA